MKNVLIKFSKKFFQAFFIFYRLGMEMKMNITPTTQNQNFTGKLILSDSIYPRRKYEVVPKFLKTIVDEFEKRTAGENGTMFVAGLTKNPYKISYKELQMNTYFRNKDYKDAIAVRDNGLFASNWTKEGFYDVNGAINKFVKIFEVFKHRESFVNKAVNPVKRKWTNPKRILDILKYDYEMMLKKKLGKLDIMAEAQKTINGNDKLALGSSFDSHPIKMFQREQDNIIEGLV